MSLDLLKEITESDVGVEEKKKGVRYRLRKAARAVVFNKDKQIAVLFVSKYGYHKLPGGGVEEGEELLSALKREVREEVGCDINVTSDCVGVIIEYRDDFEELQISYCWLAQVVGEVVAPAFTEKEISHGFELKWMSVGEMIGALQKDQPTSYEGKFIRIRDLAFLEKAREVLQ